jgi:2-polyprenyl-3-methyl-5-hydroxy-6-metoxy-1,4-benzoquinol methylase
MGAGAVREPWRPLVELTAALYYGPDGAMMRVTRVVRVHLSMKSVTASRPPTKRAGCPVCHQSAATRLMNIDEVTLATRTTVDWPIVRCGNCNLVYVASRIAQSETSEIYHDHAYEFQRSGRTDAVVDGRPHGARVISELGKHVAPGRLIDIGCGTGEFMRQAQAAGWQAEGVELAPHLSEVARQRGLKVTTGTLEDANLPDGVFDAATLLDVVEHLEDPLATLAEINRILRPGGALVMETPNWNSVYRRLLGRWWAALQPRLHLLYLDPASAADILSRAGFTPVETTTEIVALFSAEARARGLGPSYFSHVARQTVVRHLLRHEHSALDRLFLGLRRKPAQQAQPRAGESAPEPAAKPAPRPLPLLNRPLDGFFLKRQMGEQLRVIAVKKTNP